MEHLKTVLKKQYIFIILLIFWAISMLISPFFRTVSTFSEIFIVAVPIVLIGFAQNIVVIGQGFDLSVGSVASLSGGCARNSGKGLLFPSRSRN